MAELCACCVPLEPNGLALVTTHPYTRTSQVFVITAAATLTRSRRYCAEDLRFRFVISRSPVRLRRVALRYSRQGSPHPDSGADSE